MKQSKTFINYLIENPYNQHGELPRYFQEYGVVSDDTLKRAYEFLTEYKFGIYNIRFYKKNATNTINGFITIQNNERNTHTNKIIFSLIFYDEQTLNHKIKNAFQVESVIVDKNYDNLGIASYVYLYLISKNMIIISDSTQFDSGKYLWKKLARESKFKDYKILVFNDDTGEYLKDKNDNMIEYDNTNLDDSEIWSKNKDYSKMEYLLVLSRK